MKLPETASILRAEHGRVGQPHAQQGFDFEADGADGIHDAAQRLAGGDAQAVVEGRGQSVLGQIFVDLRARAVHQHQTDTQRMQQGDVVNDVAEVVVVDRFAPKQSARRSCHDGR
jgi:hypothetical protein